MTETDRDRFYNIDLLRFLAAISVVLFHYTVVIGQKEGLNTLAFLHLGEFTKYGYLGVNLFFMISGFVILMSAQSGNVVKFVLYRFTRLYPTFWFAVCLTAICIVFFDSNLYYVEIKQILINLSMMPTIFNTPYVDSVYWTLLLELKFYAFIVLLLLLKQMKHIIIYIFGWLLISFFYYFTSLPCKCHILFSPVYGSYFIAGMVFFLIRLEGVSPAKIFLLFLAYILSLLFELQNINELTHDYKTNFSAGIIIAVITLLYVIFSLISIKKISFLNNPIFYYMGILTYPLYLIHQRIGFLIFQYFQETINHYLLLILTIFGMFIIAYLIHKYIEIFLSLYLRSKLSIIFLKKQVYKGDK